MQTRSRPSFARKIVDLDALRRHRETARRAGKSLVHCHGCFDIVHPGHIRYLQFAKSQGDYLLVSLTGDPHVGKGEGRPYIPQELRAENLAALEFVDFVYVNPEPTAVNLLATLQPDVYIKGREYEHNAHPGFLKEKSTVEAHGGRVIFSSGDVIYSSSHLIENYAARLDLEAEKLALFCRRYDISRDRLEDLLELVVDKPVLIMGDTILDRYQYCDASDLAADAPMISLTPLESRDYLAGAAMVARHLAALGAEVTLLTSLGTDDVSDRALDSLEEGGVHLLAMRNRRRIATRTRYVVDTQKLFLVDESPSTPTDSANEKWALEQIARLASADTTLLLYDAGLGCLTDPLTAQTIAQRQGFARLVAGTAPTTRGGGGRLAYLTDADLLVSTERALRAATRDFDQGLSSVAYRLLDMNRAGSLLVPLGKKGLLCFDHRQDSAPTDAWDHKLRSEYLASPLNGSIASVDRLGFDEALLALAAGLLGAGANIHQAAYLGLAAAVLQTRSPGHQPVDPHELRSLLQHCPELQP